MKNPILDADHGIRFNSAKDQAFPCRPPNFRAKEPWPALNPSVQTMLMRILRAVWVAAVAAGLFLAAWFLIPLAYPFLIAWAVAYLLNPLVNLMQRRLRMPRWFASVLALVVALGSAAAVVALLVNKLIVEIGRLARYIDANIRNWIDAFMGILNSETIQSFLLQLNALYTQNQQITHTIDQNLESAGLRIAQAITNLFNSVVNWLISLVAALPNIAFIVLIALLAAFFMSKDWYKWADRLSGVLPPSIHRSISAVWNELQRALFGYLRSLLIMVSLTALFMILGMWILGVPNPFAVGLLLGLLDLLPYVGIGLVIVPWVIYCFIQGNIALGLGLAILYAIVFVVRSLVEPKVLAASIGMDSLMTLISMVIGLRLFGVAGIIIGPVTLVILLSMHRTRVFHRIAGYIRGGTAGGS